VQALAQRTEFPFVRDEHGLTVLFLAAMSGPMWSILQARRPRGGPRSYGADGLDRALLCLSSPLGIEVAAPRAGAAVARRLPRGRARARRAVRRVGAIALDDPDPDDVDRALHRGCVGISLPAGALAGVDRLTRVRRCSRAFLARRALVRPPRSSRRARSRRRARSATRSGGPRLTHYVADMARGLAPRCSGPAGPSTQSCGCSSRCSPASRRCTASALAARGGLDRSEPDPLVFYDTSSYGPLAIGALSDAIGGPGQLLYGSDRPVVEAGAPARAGGARLGVARRRHRRAPSARRRQAV